MGFMQLRGIEHVKIPPAAHAQTVVLNEYILQSSMVFARYLRIPDLERSSGQKGQAILYTFATGHRASCRQLAKQTKPT